MSWQEDLRRLDADLAAGRIEAAAHRKQRDELLAQASGSTVPSPVPSPLRRPATTWQSRNPAAPLPGTNGSNGSGSHAHQGPSVAETQARPGWVRQEAAPVPVDRPPYHPPHLQPLQPHRAPGPVPPWQRTHHGVPVVADHLTTAPSPADINPTRYLEVGTPAPEPPAPVQPPAPPPGPHGREDQVAPERRKPTWLFLALGVLVVLAMIVGAIAWLGSGGSSAPQASAPTSAPGTGAPAPLDERVPQLPGTQNPNNSTMSVAKGLELGLYPAATADLLTANGATSVIYRGAADSGTSYLVLVVPTGSPAGAAAIVEQLYQRALSGGFRTVQSPLRTVSGQDGGTFLNTTWYGSGNTVVSVGIAQPFHGQAGLSGELDRAVKTLETALPVS